jgi:hypothetical protein
MLLRLGIDIACRDAPQVSLADKQGQFIWTGRRFAPHRAGTSRRADHRNLERVAVESAIRRTRERCGKLV